MFGTEHPAFLAVETGTILWPALLIVSALVLAVAVLVARRIYLKSLGSNPQSEAFPVEGLTELRDAGELSEDEFKRLRRAALGLDAGGKEKEDSQSSTHVKLDDEAVNDADD